MKKVLLISLLIFTLILTGCDINFKINGKDNDKPAKDETIIEDISKKNETIEGTYVIAEDDSLISSPNYSDEIGDSTIQFKADNTFIAYLGFGNNIGGTYTIKGDTINCEAKEFVNEYSPLQDISAKFSFTKISDAILKVKSASPSYEVSTTYMDENGEWIFDGETKEMPLTSFTEGTIYTLWMQMDY